MCVCVCVCVCVYVRVRGYDVCMCIYISMSVSNYVSTTLLNGIIGMASDDLIQDVSQHSGDDYLANNLVWVGCKLSVSLKPTHKLNISTYKNSCLSSPTCT